MNKNTLTLPLVHLNGSGRTRLMEQYHKAYMALQEALEAMREVDIHDRDYYPQGPASGPQARREQQSRIDKLLDVQEEISSIYQSLES